MYRPGRTSRSTVSEHGHETETPTPLDVVGHHPPPILRPSPPSVAAESDIPGCLSQRICTGNLELWPWGRSPRLSQAVSAHPTLSQRFLSSNAPATPPLHPPVPTAHPHRAVGKASSSTVLPVGRFDPQKKRRTESSTCSICLTHVLSVTQYFTCWLIHAPF